MSVNVFLYGSLLAVRLLCALFSPSFVHPDEFHQLSEPTVSAALSVDATVAWEFATRPHTVTLPVDDDSGAFNVTACSASHAPLRSVAAGPLWFAVLPSLALVRPLLPWLPIAWRSWVVASVPRVAFFLLSLALDAALLLMAERGVGASVSGTDALLALASSHAVLVFHARTFSNAVESVALALLLAVVLLTQTAPRVSMRTVLVGAALFGAVSAWGVMVRFTFVAFAAPAALMTLSAAYRRARALRDLYTPAELSVLFLAPIAVAVAAFCVCVTSMAFVDELWFGTRRLALWSATGAEPQALALHDLLPTLARPWLWARVGELAPPPSPMASWHGMQRWLSCLAPLNALRYNTQTSNLAEHGIHPRVTHALVNMPLMFGPLALYLCASAARFLYARLLAVVRESAQAQPEQPEQQQRPRVDGPKSPLARRRQRIGIVEPLPHDESRLLFAATLVCGLCVLSLAPHQEARFLAPLTAPTILLGCSWLGLSNIERRSQWTLPLLARWLLWAAFNGALLLLLGVAHQGGILRAMSHLYSSAAAEGGSGAANPAATATTTTVLFYSTYTPPLHLMLQSDARVGRSARLEGALAPNTYDVYSVPRGALHAVLDQTIAQQLNRALAQNAAPMSVLNNLRLLIVAPKPALLGVGALLPAPRAGELGALRSLVAPFLQALEETQAAAGSSGARHDLHAAHLAHQRAQLSKQLVSLAQVDAAARHLGAAWQPAFEYQLTEAKQFWPHVSFEDLPASLDDAALLVVRVRVRTVALEQPRLNK